MSAEPLYDEATGPPDPHQHTVHVTGRHCGADSQRKPRPPAKPGTKR